MKAVIRSMEPEEFPQLREFLYLSIFVHQGEAPPGREILDTPEFQVYLERFGAGPGDCAVVAEVDGALAGAANGFFGRRETKVKFERSVHESQPNGKELPPIQSLVGSSECKLNYSQAYQQYFDYQSNLGNTF